MSKPTVKPIDDEWWTTAMVCAHLKLGKRALWDIRRDPVKRFPEAIKPGGKVNLFRASDVRGWMDERLAAAARPSPKPAPVEAIQAPAPTVQAAQDHEQPARRAEPPAHARRRRRGAEAVDESQLELF